MNIEKLSFDDAFDSAIIQKLLPKIHGSRKRILPLLERLAQLCVSTPEGFNLASVDRTLNGNNPQIKYQLSFDKISRMYDRAIQDGFTSFAEA